MRRQRPRTPSIRQVLFTLVAVSLVALVTPAAWTAKLISLVQLILPFQQAADVTAETIASTIRGSGAPVPAETHRQLELRTVAAEHRVAALAARVAELEGEVEILTATRRWELEGGRIGVRGKLIPADVLAGDLLPWRSSRLIGAGALQGVRRGSAVTSQHFSIAQGESAGVRRGLAVLLGEVLLGVVDQVGTHTARFKLLCDVTSGMKVRIGRLTDQGYLPHDGYLWLTGHGDGVMRIRDVDRRHVQEGLIAIGDIVLSDPMSELLPAAMTVGKVTAIEPDHQNPLLSILTVRSEIDDAALRRVYVYEPETQAPDEPAPRSEP